MLWPLVSAVFDLPDRTAYFILAFSPPVIFALSVCTLIAVLKAMKQQQESDSWLLFIAFPTLVFSAFFLFWLVSVWLADASTEKHERQEVTIVREEK